MVFLGFLVAYMLFKWYNWERKKNLLFYINLRIILCCWQNKILQSKLQWNEKNQ